MGHVPVNGPSQVRVVTFKDVNIEEVENPSCACRNSCSGAPSHVKSAVRQSVGRNAEVRWQRSAHLAILADYDEQK